MSQGAREAAIRLAVATLPGPLLQLALDFAAACVTRRHPSILSRLSPCAGARILIEPLELSGAFVLALGEPPGRLSLHVAAPSERARATARIGGPLAALFALLEGSVDGDALFFARDLAVSGDTEAIVALRNALDGEEIDLVEDLLQALGPLAAPTRGVLGAAASLARLAESAAELWRDPPPRDSGSVCQRRG